MAEQLDPRLEARLRAALHADADALPFTISGAEVRRRATVRARARSRQRLTLLSAAAAAVIAVAGVAAFNALRTQDRTAGPGLADLPSYEALLTAGQGFPELARSESGAIAQDGQWQVGVPAGHGAIEVVVACSGRDASVSTSADGAPIRIVAGVTCDGQPVFLNNAGGGAFASAASPAVVVTARAGTAFRLVVLDGSGVEPGANGAPPRRADANGLATAEALLNELVQFDSGAVLLTDEHLAIEPGTTVTTWDAGAITPSNAVHLAVTCFGPSVTIGIGDGTTFESSTQVACDPIVSATSLPGVLGQGGTPHVMVEAAPSVRWRIAAAVGGSPAASVEPSELVMPSLPADVVGGEVIAQISGAEPGTSTMTNPVPEGTTGFLVVVTCRGTGTLDIDLDGVAAMLPCEPLTIESFVPPLGATSTIKVSPKDLDAYLLEVRAITGVAPGVTFVPPVATLAGPDGSVPGYAGCGLSYTRASGGNASEDCGPSWMPIPDDRAIQVASAGTLTLSLPAAWTITGVRVQATDHATIQPSGRGPAASDLFSGTPGSQSVPLPVPGAGDWGLRIEVSATNADGTTFSVPYYARVIVTP
jgi:hypothetical protein